MLLWSNKENYPKIIPVTFLIWITTCCFLPFLQRETLFTLSGEYYYSYLSSLYITAETDLTLIPDCDLDCVTTSISDARYFQS